MTVFKKAQPAYAAYRIATIPVDGNSKKPLVRGPARFGLRGSNLLANKFNKATALGFVAGPRNRVTVLDVDTPSETSLADAMQRYGESPLVVRTKGGFHAYYRHNGERRQIRPDKTRPVDILGSGLVLAPPSQTGEHQYEIIRGKLDDLDRLPIMQAPPLEPRISTEGQRNRDLWQHCMRQAHHCDDFNALLDVAHTFNTNQCQSPLSEEEVLKAAQSAWDYTDEGLNRFGQHGAWFPVAEAIELARNNQDALILLAFLRATQGPTAVFIVANSMAKLFGWGHNRLAAARTSLVRSGRLQQVSRECPAQYRAARYSWPKIKGGGVC